MNKKIDLIYQKTVHLFFSEWRLHSVNLFALSTLHDFSSFE